MDFSDLKTKGVIVLYNGQPHEVIWSQFVRMQQRKPVIQTKLRNLVTGKVLDYSFKSGEKVEEAEVTKQTAQYQYNDDSGAHFMNNDTYETIDLPKEIAQDKVGYLKEGENVTMKYFDGRPISLELPIKVDLKVKDTPPGIRGDTSKSGNKPARVETGATIQVPLFVDSGDVIRVDTRTGNYVSRA